jgi:hypothetical protein
MAIATSHLDYFMNGWHQGTWALCPPAHVYQLSAVPIGHRAAESGRSPGQGVGIPSLLGDPPLSLRSERENT